MEEALKSLRAEAEDVMRHNILSFWLRRMADPATQGFYGRIDGRGNLHPEAERGAILNARILWAFSSAYRVTGEREYLDAATMARDYILRHFVDRQYGGVFWSLNADGTPADTKKQSYAIGFTIYGLSEYARATGDTTSLHEAINLYRSLEQHAFDAKGCGYIEALTRDWQPIEDMRLSDKDENGSRTMNTHLHIIEPYTNLLRVWRTPELEDSVRTLLRIFTEKLLNPNGHLDLFFDDNWQGRRDIESYGHDIEAAWLLHETALVLGDGATLRKIEPTIKRIAAASRDGLDASGAMIHEKNTRTGSADGDFHWWVQCENIIGNFDLYQYFGDREALKRATDCWEWVKLHLIDRAEGEWHWSVRADGTLNTDDDKAGFWKCPYHNTRLCTELMERIDAMAQS